AIRAADRQRFDLILMDVQMPDLDGLEATAEIRARERERGTGHVPIVALTAHAMKGDRERCLAVGMDDYVAKPLDPEDLFAAIECCASSRRICCSIWRTPAIRACARCRSWRCARCSSRSSCAAGAARWEASRCGPRPRPASSAAPSTTPTTTARCRASWCAGK